MKQLPDPRSGGRAVRGVSAEFSDRIMGIGLDSGLAAIGVTGVEPFREARSNIEERKGRGLHGGMWFTYGRPERSSEPSRIMTGANSIVVGALSYYRNEDASATARVSGVGRTSGVVARYVWERFYDQLRDALAPIAAELIANGWKAQVVIDDNRLIDRAAAYRAGLGWFGKNTNLLLDGCGSWFVLGSVVTDCELTRSEAPVEDGCGSCTRCQVACPTGALDEAGVLDARRCLAWLVQADGVFPMRYREALGDRLYGCDDCQEVCPPNIRQVQLGPTRRAAPDAQTTVDVLELLALDDETLMERLGHWYVPRRRPEYLRRNALIVLGNVADASTEAVREAVASALSDGSAVVRAHAVWAARRLGYRDLVDAVPADEHRLVLAEIGADVAVRGGAGRPR